MRTATNDLISVDDAAEAYNLSRATLFRLIDRKQLKSFKRLGDKRTLVSKAALKKLLVPEERE